MSSHRLQREQVLARPLPEVFAFFAGARNLERLTPPWLSFQVLTPEPILMQQGTQIDYRLTLHGLPLRWRTRIEEWQPERRFVDRQLHGPYRLWHHTHEFDPHPHGTIVRDRVRYVIALGPLGALARMMFVRRDLERVFDFRQQAVTRLLEG